MIEIVKRHLTLNPCYVANVNKADSRYVLFQQRGPQGGVLHSVGCAQPSAEKFLRAWNKPTYTNSCVHGVIDAETGVGYETLPPNFRGWHGASGPKGSVNNTHIGIEMCESRWIKYTSGAKFEVLDLAKARADCKRAYETAVYWFAKLAKEWHWNVDTDIISHNEGAAKGIASDHGDPEHYWKGIGLPYTMNGFRADVKARLESQEDIDMTEEQLEQFVNGIIDERFPGLWDQAYQRKMASLSDNDCGRWSRDARAWAIEKGIISGVGTLPDGTTNYAWQQPLTREQFVTIEYKKEKKKGGDGDA